MGAPRDTTQRQTEQKTELTIHYEFHPWASESVQLVKRINRGSEPIYRVERISNGKKRILRTLIKEILVDVDQVGGKIHLTIHWHGRVHTNLTVPRRKRGCAVKTSADTIEAVRLLALVASDEMIAGLLNRNGLLTGKGNRFTRARIVSLRSYHKIPIYNPEEKEKNGWMTLSQAADYLDISPRTLRLATDKGEIPSHHPLSDGPWIFQRKDLDTDTAQAVRHRAGSRRKRGAIPNSNQQNLDFSGT